MSTLPAPTEFPDLPGVTHRFVTARGLRVHVAEAGQGEPLVLQHGWPQHWYAWHAVIPLLAEHYRVICPDMRGFGWTDAPRSGYDKDTLADDLLAVCDELELDRFALAGRDWGRFVAFLTRERSISIVYAEIAGGAPAERSGRLSQQAAADPTVAVGGGYTRLAAPSPKFSAHQMGSCRMGSDPHTRVAGPFGELHDTRGVWNDDGSAFPTPSGVNPMLSIMALAHRTAEAIAAAAGKPTTAATA